MKNFLLLFLATMMGHAANFITCGHSLSANKRSNSDKQTFDSLNSIDFSQRLQSKKTRYWRPFSAHPCPKSCRCAIATIADCSRLKMKHLPCDKPVVVEGTIAQKRIFSSELRSFYATYNRIQKMRGSCFAASGKRLETLSLRSNAISSIDKDAFKGCSVLKTLDLSNNRLSSIVCVNCSTFSNKTTSLFAALRHSLTTLLLSYNKIMTIPKRSFLGFKILKVLSLDHNMIRWISLKAFQDLSNLKFMLLRGNPLISVAASRINLNMAWLSNRFHFVSDFQAVFVANLSEISMCIDDATFDDVNNNVSAGARLLHHTVMWQSEHKNLTKFTKVTNISKTAYLKSTVWQQYNSSIIFQAASNKTLAVLDLGDVNLNEVPIGLPKTLNTLYLDENNISCINIAAFSEMFQLQFLHLSNNKITTLLPGTFSGLSNLLLLDLSSNNITNLHPKTFCGLKILFYLKLSNNSQLASLPKEVFDHTPLLAYFYAHNCGLQTLPGGTWVFNLIGLWLYGNPIHCDCNSIASIVVKMKHGNPTSFRKNLYLDDYKNKLVEHIMWIGLTSAQSVCHTPAHLHGRLIKNITVKELGCSEKDLAQIMVNRKLGNSFIFVSLGNDLGSAEYENYDEPVGELSNDTSVKNQSLHRAATITELQPNENVTTILYNYTRDTLDYDTFSGNFKNRNSAYSNNAKSRFTTRNAESRFNKLTKQALSNTSKKKDFERLITKLPNYKDGYDTLQTNSSNENVSVDKIPKTETVEFDKSSFPANYSNMGINEARQTHSKQVKSSSSADYNRTENYLKNYETNRDQATETTNFHKVAASSTADQNHISFENYLNSWLNITQQQQLKRLIKQIWNKTKSKKDHANFKNATTKYLVKFYNFTVFPPNENEAE